MALTKFDPSSRFGSILINIVDDVVGAGILLAPSPNVRWVLHKISIGVNTDKEGVGISIYKDATLPPLQLIYSNEAQTPGAPYQDTWEGWTQPANSALNFQMRVIDLPGPAGTAWLKNFQVSADILIPDPDFDIAALYSRYDIATGNPILGSGNPPSISDSY